MKRVTIPPAGTEYDPRMGVPHILNGVEHDAHPGETCSSLFTGSEREAGLDVETLQYALEAVDPVAFARDGTAAVSREDVDHFRYAHAVAAEYARLITEPETPEATDVR